MFRTDFKNDKLLVASNTKRKFNVIENADGTVSFEDVTAYEVKGDNFGADEVNAIHEGLNTLMDEVGVSKSRAEIVETLAAGETSIAFENKAITTSSTIDIYTDVYGVNPTDISVEDGIITLTFKEQDSDVSVKVRVS